MNIKEITVERLKNLGNYESKRLNVTAQIDKGDDVDKIIDNLEFYLDFKLNEEQRSIKLAEIKQELENGILLNGKDLTEEAAQQRKEWIAKYKEATARFLDLEFV